MNLIGKRVVRGQLRRVSKPVNPSLITGNLLLVVVLWGGNNVGTKWLLTHGWPPLWTGGIRFLIAGGLLLAVLRLTNWLGRFPPPSRAQRRQLCLRGGLVLAAYIVVFCWALKLTTAAHVALYIGASPVWSLLMEERPQLNWLSARRYAAALLALAGVLVLFRPALTGADFNFAGEICGLLASLAWAVFNVQSRVLARDLSGLEVAANSMWMSGAMLMPLTVFELWPRGIVLDAAHVSVQSLNIVLGSVVAYALWNTALRHWPTSRVMLFNNAIPLSTALWAHFCLGEPVTPTFCLAMLLIVAGVLLGQLDRMKFFRQPDRV